MKFGTKFFAISTLFLLTSNSVSGKSWIDTSHNAFISHKMEQTAVQFQQYPLFWWNFLVIKGSVSESDLESFCSKLIHSRPTQIKALPCAPGLDAYKSLISDWVADSTLRHPYPGHAQLQQLLSTSFAKAALPIPRSLLDLLRLDPMNSLNELRQILANRNTLDAKKTKHIWLPIQFAFPARDSQLTAAIADQAVKECRHMVGCEDIWLYGPHNGSLENERRVQDDVTSVSRMGFVALSIIVLIIVLSGRGKLLFLFPILAIAIVGAGLITVGVYGSIHALTLAFGPGIAGLALDYGIHAAFMDPRSRQTWKANFAGYLTTAVVLVLFLFSSIPLLRQMMFFALTGLTLAFLLFFIFLSKLPSLFKVRSFSIRPNAPRWSGIVTLIFLTSAFLVCLRPLHIDLRSLNFESKVTTQLNHELFSAQHSLIPYWVEFEKTEDTYEAARWAQAAGIRYEGPANFLPPLDVQTKNLDSWKRAQCDNYQIAQKYQILFSPFFNLVNCNSLSRPRDINSRASYLRDFFVNQRSLALFFPADEIQISNLLQRFPTSTSAKTLFSTFPKDLTAELLWIMPFAYFCALFFLWSHFRRLSLAAVSTVPFFTGLGLYAICLNIFKMDMSFISLIGLLMVFGFSLDYGIFVADFFDQKKSGSEGVWSALMICSLSTIAGFFPLLFAEHPVLKDLGLVLFCGSLGTLLGTIWGIHSIMQWLKVKFS